MANALEQELMQYIHQLDEAEKKSILQMLKTFVKGRGSRLNVSASRSITRNCRRLRLNMKKGNMQPMRNL